MRSTHRFVASSFALACVAALPGLALAGIQSFAPDLSFSGDGYLSNAENALVQAAGDNQRGMAFNPATNSIYVINRTGPAVNIFDSTGASAGTLSVTGVSGGLLTLGAIRVDSAGVIYATNVGGGRTTAVSPAVPADPSLVKVYRWASEASAPTVAFSGNPDGIVSSVQTTNNVKDAYRIGDTLDLINTGDSTLLVSGINTSASPVGTFGGTNGYVVFSSQTGTSGASLNATRVAFPATPPNAGDFRLGLTFTGSDTVIGSQGSSLVRHTDFSGTTGTLAASPTYPNISGNSRAMDYAVVGGVPLLAILDTGATGVTTTGPNTVRLWDMTDPLNPVFVGSARAAGAVNAVSNANATGAVAFGEIVGNTAKLYTLVTNNGISAYTITVPEPATLGALAGVAVLTLARRRKA